MSEKPTNNELQKLARPLGEAKSENFSVKPDLTSHARIIEKLASAKPNPTRCRAVASQQAKPAAPAGKENKN